MHQRLASGQSEGVDANAISLVEDIDDLFIGKLTIQRSVILGVKTM